jgi:hypothetical protein
MELVLASSKYVSNNETESMKNTAPMAVFASFWKFPVIVTKFRGN